MDHIGPPIPPIEIDTTRHSASRRAASMYVESDTTRRLYRTGKLVPHVEMYTGHDFAHLHYEQRIFNDCREVDDHVYVHVTSVT